MRRLVVAGAASAVGKTTVACGLMAAFARRGLRVQPFKVGPDYIDTTHHSEAAGRASRNLDSILLPAPALKALFTRAAASAELCVVEGVMGLFDGRNDRGEEGSTAQMAKLLNAPVLVVIDAAKTARTAGVVALGCVRFDPDLRVVGFILNRVASPTHARIATEAIEAATGLPVLGALPRNDHLTVPERHLGLVPATEVHLGGGRIDRLADAAERHFDLDRISTLAESPPLAAEDWDGFPSEPHPRVARIAIARDEAFGFYYLESLELLEAWGGEIVPFSPLRDESLPSGVQGVYLGGGFPELFAAELTRNRPLRRSLRNAARVGLPIYGECGGLMYLGRTLTDLQGKDYAMAGVLPISSRMQRQRATLGYRGAVALRSTPLLDAGARVVGHEFHYSQLAEAVAPHTAAYRVTEPEESLEGYAAGNVLASYVHLHFGSEPGMAGRFVATCASYDPVG